MEKIIKVAGVQLASTTDKAYNLKRAVDLITIAAEKGALVISLPQLFANFWFPHSIDKAAFALAEPADGETVSLMRGLSEKLGIVIVCPVFEKSGDDYFNSAFVLGPGGEILGSYRKVHVPQIPMWEEASYFKGGDLGFPVIETPFGRIGIQLCWDIFFPEGMRALALGGAELVVAPTASAFVHSSERWERAIRAAAHSNGLYILRVNRVGGSPDQEFYGKSFCARPDGDLTDEPGGPSEGVILTKIDLAEITRVRNEWVFLRDRRPKEYSKLVEEKN